MFEFGLGSLGVSLDSFLKYEIYDYVCAVKGYRSRMREFWEMTRSQGYFSMIAINGSKNIDYSNIRLPIDGPEKIGNKKRVKWRKLT